MTLPSDWAAAADAGSKAMSGSWSDTSADDTGTAEHYRLYKSDGTTCVMQGSVTVTGGGGDLTLDNTSIATGQTVTITYLRDGKKRTTEVTLDSDEGELSK